MNDPKMAYIKSTQYLKNKKRQFAERQLQRKSYWSNQGSLQLHEDGDA